MKIKANRNTFNHSFTPATGRPAASMTTSVSPRPPQRPSTANNTGSRGVFHSAIPLTEPMTKPAYINVQKANTPAAINKAKTGDAHWVRIMCIKPRIMKSPIK